MDMAEPSIRSGGLEIKDPVIINHLDPLAARRLWNFAGFRGSAAQRRRVAFHWRLFRRAYTAGADRMGTAGRALAPP
jgi:hypothetical protein